MRSGRARRGQRGFTLLILLFFVVLLGAAAAGAGVVWHSRAMREKEAELLAVGVEFARALASYHAVQPDPVLGWPEHLEDLLEDKRFLTVKRHLRRIYRDPMTKDTEWGLVRQGGRIIGIHSLSEGEPIRSANLPPELGEAGAQATCYCDWIFRPRLDDAGGAAGAAQGGKLPGAARAAGAVRADDPGLR
jgi:type II secretory pathway pseudopilin PulG